MAVLGQRDFSGRRCLPGGGGKGGGAGLLLLSGRVTERFQRKIHPPRLQQSTLCPLDLLSRGRHTRHAAMRCDSVMLHAVVSFSFSSVLFPFLFLSFLSLQRRPREVARALSPTNAHYAHRKHPRESDYWVGARRDGQRLRRGGLAFRIEPALGRGKEAARTGARCGRIPPDDGRRTTSMAVRAIYISRR